MLGVNVIPTPTLLTFAQLQNFFMYISIKEKWPQYFWSHMDVGVMSHEAQEPYESMYTKAVYAVRNATAPGYGRWAQVLFSYDRLALVNTAAYVEVGGWDTHIPYYGTDCDMHERLDMAGFRRDEMSIGDVIDIGTSLDDLLVLYRKTTGPSPSFTNLNPPAEPEDKATKEALDTKKRDGVHLVSENSNSRWPEHVRGDDSYLALKNTFLAMSDAKHNSPRGRNTWQHRQSGGQGEPYYRDPVGFETALWMTVDEGRRIFAEKWGHQNCDLIASGLKAEHAWRVEKDWEWRDKHSELEAAKE